MTTTSQQRDPIYYSCVLLLAASAVGFAIAYALTGLEYVGIRAGSTLIALALAVGLALRGRSASAVVPTMMGLAVVVVCGAQLAIYISGTRNDLLGSGPGSITQNFAAGMFCIGAALVLDGVLPARWGRHIIFGLLGAVAAGIGVLGILGLLSNLPPALELDLLRGLRLPSALVLVFGGLALLTGARLRGISGPMLGSAASGEEFRDRTGIAAGLAMLVITAGATLLLWRQASDEIAVREEQELRHSVSRFATALQSNALSPTTLLDALRGLFGASNVVEPEEWQYFTDRLRIADRYTGIVGLGFARQVTSPLFDGDGNPQIEINGRKIAIWPPELREKYYPIIYRSPPEGAYSHVIGYDIAAAPQSAMTIARALETREEALSARVDFSTLSDPEKRVGYVLVMPLFASEDRHGENADEVQGLAYVAVDMRAVVERSLRDIGNDAIHLSVVDADADQSASLLFEDEKFDASLPVQKFSVSVAGRTWDIIAHRDVASVSPSAARPSTILMGGALCAVLLFAITWVLAGHRARAMHLARMMNAELRKSQRSYRAITDTANVGIVTADSDGNILYMNPAAAQSFGFVADAMVGQPLTQLMPERYRDAHLAGMQRLFARSVESEVGHTLEIEGRRSDGTEFPMELLISLWSSDGQSYLTAFVRDITKRRKSQADLEQRTRELERSNADLEQFAYVASHDLQEPLRMVASYVQLLARRYKGRLDSDADEFIDFAVDGATRMQRLIQDLLAYARLGRSGKTPIPTHVGDCAESAVAQLQEAILESRARVIVNGEYQVMAIPSQLTQLFQNLIGNALKFRSDAEPRIDIDATREGPMWHVRVRDNGIGIAPQHAERVFAIFQRLHTRSEYAGTGIGLAICRKIVEGAGGKIWVESTPGSGCTFHFTLPAA